MVYRLITPDEPDSSPIGANLAGIWVISTLEVALRDEAGAVSMALSLGSYGLDTDDAPVHGEGYWAPPNVAYPIETGYSVPGTVGSLRRKIAGLSRSQIRTDMEQLAYSMGLRDADLIFRGEFTEIKISPRTAGGIKAYCIMRWGVANVDIPSIRNLTDPDVCRGYVFLPIDNDARLISRRYSGLHQREERWFLGKPIISNVDTVLSNEAIKGQISSAAINVPRSAFFRKEQGLVCVVDLAGYGSAVKYAHSEMHTFNQSNDEIATLFRQSVAAHLEQMAAEIGTTQVHTAGDGFIAALPERSHGCELSLVIEVMSAWEEILKWVEKLNTQIRDANLRIGSRIALHRGEYYFGRIGGLASFSPSFDGDSIINAARLEQSLGIAMKEHVEVGDSALVPRGDYAILSSAFTADAPESLASELANWSYMGELAAAAKEHKETAAILQYLAL